MRRTSTGIAGRPRATKNGANASNYRLRLVFSPFFVTRCRRRRRPTRSALRLCVSVARRL